MFKKTSFIFFLSISMPLFLILPSCQGQTEARRIYQVEKGDLIIATEADCKVISKNVSNISFEINGKLKNIIDENIKLKKGDLVAELEREEIEVEIEAAELQISAKHKEMDLAKIDLKEALEKHHVIVQLLELNKKIAEQEMLGAYQGLEDAISYLNEIEDSAVYDEAQEEMAEGSVHEAETQYNIAELQRGTTYWEMLGQKLSAQNAIDKARENIALIEENIRLLEKKVENLSNNLEKTRLVSPIEGALIETYANMGEIVTAGKPVAQIKDLDSIEIVALVDEDDLGGIKEGQAVEITINAYPDKTFEGKVRLVSNKSMEEMGVVYFKVYISFKETPDLLAGLSGDVRIVTDKIEDTIVIPNDAVKERGEKDFVYIKKDGEIIEKEIKINARNNNFSSVSEGLNEGDKLLFPEDLEE